ncbi:hypothetical protein LPJ53_000691 [Coemansia erecta]|uniref:Wbp11/ELF5/Saf1 N-terminal domain-containing protein n=1 Tax=Coemansia erecta TaxID=147472 RepID=A0A9W8CVE1_9FUNG|nr:hypothetical protein LPJ53_000691 [Coemansia erecta]
MAKDKSLGANPADVHRKRMQEREAKRNKEVRKKMREAAVLNKDTAKMESRIEQYKNITQTRKMTAGEREKLQKLEEELQDIKDKQAKAGVTPQSRSHAGPAIGYDPLAEADSRSSAIDGQYMSSDADEDNDNDQQTTIDDLGIPTIAVYKEHSAEDAGLMPPMPPGTPPLLPQDLDIGPVWPPLPQGPSPMLPASAARPPPPFPPGLPPGMPPPPRPPRHALARPPARPVSATVLSAEPQVRDLKKELTSLVPSAISRKSKQKERQKVLDTIPMAPRMMVNAAPDIETEATDGSSGSAGSSLLGSIKPVAGVQFSTGLQLHHTQSSKPQTSTQNADSSLDEEYQKFMSQMKKLQ